MNRMQENITLSAKRLHRDPEDHGGPGAGEKQGVLGETLVRHGMIVGEGEGGCKQAAAICRSTCRRFPRRRTG